LDVTNTLAPTINWCGLGAKPIAQLYGAQTLTLHQISASTMHTFVYDSYLQVWTYWNNNGVTQGVPIAVTVALCNVTHTNCWVQIPTFFDPVADSASITSFATYMATALVKGLKWFPEYSNEIFNFQNYQTERAEVRGLQRGFPATSGVNELAYDEYAYNRYLVMQLVSAAWVAAGRSMTDLERMETCTCTGSIVENLRLLGNDLTFDSSNNFTLGAGASPVSVTGSVSTTACAGISSTLSPTGTMTVNSGTGIQLGMQVIPNGGTSLPLIVIYKNSSTSWCVNQATTVGSTTLTLSSGAIATNYSSSSPTHCPVCDQMDDLSYAPYLNGAQILSVQTTGSGPQLLNGTGSYYATVQTGQTLTLFQAADSCGGGALGNGCTNTGSQLAAAMTFVDYDVNHGQIATGGGASKSGNTLDCVEATNTYSAPCTSEGYFYFFNALAVKYATGSCAATPNCTIRGVWQYEGWFQDIGPSATNIDTWNTSFGSSSTWNIPAYASGGTDNCTAAIQGTVALAEACLANEFQSLLISYHLSTAYATLLTNDFDAFAAYPSSLAPAVFQMVSEQIQWSLWPTATSNIYTQPSTAYNAFTTYTTP